MSNYIKQNLIYLREKSCLTQRGTACAIGVYLETYQAWITRGIEPSTEHLKAISNFYQVSIDLLYRKDLKHVQWDVVTSNYCRIQDSLIYREAV